MDNTTNEQMEWWRGAAIYHVYLRSFKDSNNDGIGDIQGCIKKLDYIASLGVDAVWISPFFKSPMKDFGYDISDYRDVDPIFGSLDDFDQLIEKAHSLNLKVMIDQVLSHTSDQHAWFIESRENKTNDKADWYVWADPKQDGSPPNNWQSIFGGAAWQWEPRRQQYYLHNFLTSQPDLNFHNPAVQEQILEEVEFWLKRGVDGLRLDAINFCYHDKQLRDNPAKPENEREGRGFSEDNPYAYQYHYFNNTQPENLQFMEALRDLLNRYPGTVSLGEISSEDSLATMIEYTQNNKRLHMAYSFELLVDEFCTKHIRKTVEDFEGASKDSWPCWAFSNHDVTRVVSRWGDEDYLEPFSKLLLCLIGSLRGSYCIYQGEELGLSEAELEYHQLTDPYGIAFWPTFKGRDGCRTPMPWESNALNAGFSEGVPWLPVASDHRDSAVDKQERDDQSILNTFKHFLNWRKNNPALLYGGIQWVDSPDGTLVFCRNTENQRLVVCFNVTAEEKTVSLLDDWNCSPQLIDGVMNGVLDSVGGTPTVFMPAYSLFVAEI